MARVAARAVVVLFFLATSAFSQGLSCGTDCRTGSITFGANLGWVERYGGFAHTFDYAPEPSLWSDQSPLRGAWVGLFARGTLAGRVGLELSGGLLLPGDMGGENRDAVEDQSFGVSFGFTYTQFSWSIVEGLASYNVLDDLQVIGGFRWDHMSTRWEFLKHGDTWDTTMNAYLPVIGLQINQRVYEGDLITRLTGWPGPAFGELRYHWNGLVFQEAETSSVSLSEGYFLEFYAEYNRRLFGEGSLGLYVKWNSTYLQTDEGSYDWLEQNVDTGAGSMRMTQRTQYWVLGGLFSVHFNLSDLRILR